MYLEIVFTIEVMLCRGSKRRDFGQFERIYQLEPITILVSSIK